MLRAGLNASFFQNTSRNIEETDETEVAPPESRNIVAHSSERNKSWHHSSIICEKYCAYSATHQTHQLNKHKNRSVNRPSDRDKKSTDRNGPVLLSRPAPKSKLTPWISAQIFTHRPLTSRFKNYRSLRRSRLAWQPPSNCSTHTRRQTHSPAVSTWWPLHTFKIGCSGPFIRTWKRENKTD